MSDPRDKIQNRVADSAMGDIAVRGVSLYESMRFANNENGIQMAGSADSTTYNGNTNTVNVIGMQRDSSSNVATIHLNANTKNH